MRCALSSGLIAILAAIGLTVFAFATAAYIVPETEQVVLLQFGKAVGDPVTEPGLHFKLPFVQDPFRIEKRILEWDGPATEMPTKDKLYIVVDCFARWRITDPLRYLERLRDERSAQSRLTDILGGETRNVVAKNNLIEVVRTSIDRKPSDEAATATAADRDPAIAATADDPAIALPDLPEVTTPDEPVVVSGWGPITVGRNALEDTIFRNAEDKLPDLGIELLDFRFKRINYNARVSEKIYERMISERNQIAEQFRSEGAGAAARITGQRELTLREITSEAYRKVQEIRGRADAEASRIYADAYNRDAATRDFFRFLRTLESYETILDEGTSLLLNTESELFQFLKSPGNPAGQLPAPSRPQTGN